MSSIPHMINLLKWRCIGPPRGGRVIAVAGHPSNATTFYFGACAGGVWKTTDAGTYWKNISDGFFNTASVGAIAVADSDPNVIYVGMGESTIRVDVSHGDGVYKSTDGGETWIHVGLDETRHIAKVRVHPQNPNLVYIAALGHAFGPNSERGVYRSRDGGQSWERVLFKSEKAGAIDLVMDTNNPRILYAAIWEASRSFWTLSSGGLDSGIYKSVDGGDTWLELSDQKGLPSGLKGKIGLAVSPVKVGRIWAIVEAEEGGLFRSDDGGFSWERLSERSELLLRPWYFQHLVADPQNPDILYVLNKKCWKSIDGGRTFHQLTTPHGDNHDLWIDARNPMRMIEGNDGGACVSLNGGASWSSIYNQLTAQFYRVTTDNQFPYRVYGTQQDNSSISVPSGTGQGAINWAHCYPVGTGESGHIAVHPEDANIVYIGAVGSSPGGGAPLQRYDHRSGQTRLVTVWPEIYQGWGAKYLRYRFCWTFPIAFSPHDATILYAAGNVIFRSTDEGSSWEPISPDLTHNDITKLSASGGPITKDTTGAEHYATISAFAESPCEQGILWAGSDDGLLNISRDAGRTWHNVTPETLPEWTHINTIEPSPQDAATAYIAATRYKLDDFMPYLYKTHDYGRTWIQITEGIPSDDFTRVIRADPKREGLLYVGTEKGVYFSITDGQTWQPLQNNLPVVPIYDLTVKGSDLIAATHGRSFWILDDVSVLRQITNQQYLEEAYLFTPRPAYRMPTPLSSSWYGTTAGKNYHVTLGTPATYLQTETDDGRAVRSFLDAGEDRPQGLIVHYYLRRVTEEEVTLTFLTRDGKQIRKFSNRADSANHEPANGHVNVRQLQVSPALNRFVWDMRWPCARAMASEQGSRESLEGPVCLPGIYTIQLTVGNELLTADFEIRKDPRVSATRAELEAQFDFLIRIRDKISQFHGAIDLLRSICGQVQNWVDYGEDWPTMGAAAGDLLEKLSRIEGELVQEPKFGETDSRGGKCRFGEKLIALPRVVTSADSAPTRQAREVFDYLCTHIDIQFAQLQEVIDQDVKTFNKLVRDLDLPAIRLRSTM